MVEKRPTVPPTPTRAHKWPQVGEAGSSRVGEAQEWVEEVKEEEEEDVWGVRACKGIAQLNGSLEGLTNMIRWQNEILGCLVGMMEEEQVTATWRQRRQGTLVVAPVVDLSKDNEEDLE